MSQPKPTANDSPATWELVIADMRGRDRIGRAKYGAPLQPNNGRASLVDAYEEALDLAVYLRNVIEEAGALWLCECGWITRELNAGICPLCGSGNALERISLDSLVERCNEPLAIARGLRR